MERYDYFVKEFTYVQDERLRDTFKQLIELVPAYFFEIPASSSGRYHPKFALGRGGLIRHTKAAVRIAVELFRDPIFSCQFTSNERDLIIIALVLHDSFKLGLPKEAHTRFDHPLIAADFLDEVKDQLQFTDAEIQFLQALIRSHMGPWNEDREGNEVLPVPCTEAEKFVHLCDYLASKKFMNVSFDINGNIIG